MTANVFYAYLISVTSVSEASYWARDLRRRKSWSDEQDLPGVMPGYTTVPTPGFVVTGDRKQTPCLLGSTNGTLERAHWTTSVDFLMTDVYASTEL